MSVETEAVSLETGTPPPSSSPSRRGPAEMWRRSLWIWFILIGMLLLGNAVLSQLVYRELNQQRELYQRNRHLQNDLSSYLSVLKDMEIGQRGYLITGQKSYLALYNDSDRQLKSLKSRIEKNFSRDAEQQEMLADILQLADRKVRQMTHQMPDPDPASGSSTPPSAEVPLENDSGKVLMDSLRDSIGEIIQHQEQVLTAIGERSKSIRNWSSRLSFTTSICGIIFLGILYFYTRSTLRQRTKLLAEQSRSEELVRQALAEKERAFIDLTQVNKVKDEFLAIVSHELRTPLNAILGWIALLKEGATPEEQTEGWQAIDRNARAQSLLIEDLLDVSRVVMGKIRLQTRNLDLRTIALAIAESAKPALEAKNIHLEMNLSENSPAILGDEDRIQQVAWNLLSNAIKFTNRSGHIAIRVEAVDSYVAMIVKDDGLGIAPEFLPQIFNRFAQADTSTTRGQAGLGLGLAIVKHIAELHGGRVHAESAGLGKGSTFKIEFPISTQESSAAALESKNGSREPMAEMRPPLDSAPNKLPNLADLCVFVVDDQADILAMLRDVLLRCGAVVYTATNAADALENMPKVHPDILVSDIGLPDMDGYALIRQVRSLPEPELQDIPALVLTAYATNHARMNSLEAGFNDHLAKPADPFELARRVGRLAGRS